MWQIFLEFFQKVPLTMLLGTLFVAKWRISATKISLVPALTTPFISPDSGCALSNNDQIHQSCNSWKARVTGKFSSLKPTHAQVWGQASTGDTCHDFMVNRTMFPSRPHFSLLTHGWGNLSMTTCIHYLIASQMITGSCRSTLARIASLYVRVPILSNVKAQDDNRKHRKASSYNNIFQSKVLSG